MMAVSEWSDLLTRYSAAVVETRPQDFGPDEVVPVTPEMVMFGRKLKSSEKQAAGVEAARLAYSLYVDIPLHDAVSEAATLRVAGVGDMNIRTVVPYESEGMALIEADILSTA